MIICEHMLVKTIATSSNKKGAFRMLYLCFQDTLQTGLEWWFIDFETF